MARLCPERGFCIGVRGKRLAELAAPHNFNVVRCLYRHDQQQKLIQALIQEVLEENLNGDGQSEDRVPPGGNLQAYLNRYAPILKHPSFEEEHEWRIVSRPLMCSLPGFRFREGRSMLIPYYEFPLHGDEGKFPVEKVVVGPTPDPERSKASVQSFLVSQSLKDVEVTTSVVPYRNW
jgi:hypothetical protein